MFTVVPFEWFEVFGIVIIESFAMGEPVIGAEIGGIPEVVDDSVNGFLFKPGDVNDLVGKIKYLSNNKNKALDMGENGRRKVLQNYSPQVHYEKILKVYQNLIAKR